ncbi:hypothetical protein BUALT_Bualt19G0110700 [Buddleja alternifolia]|uniref:Cyclin-dependent kinase inhibitor domain-containing protein n=1 Tax=Buddleja alternifolia TaxID=168488 RepID=A0AAV6W3D9_9LAMI|nr:hypothetical protein BUALT_Bualt19G0110700 [Buddleja alternifolia]
MEDDIRLNFSKRRKLYCEPENVYYSDIEMPDNLMSPAPEASRSSGCYMYDESNDVVRRSLRSPDLESADLQSENFVTEVSKSINAIFSREVAPTSERFGDSEQLLMDSSSSTSKKKSSPEPASFRMKIAASAAEKMPTAAELEEFFAAAEKQEQKRFTEKYNYDIVKDVPLEGKYQWVRLYP